MPNRRPTANTSPTPPLRASHGASDPSDANSPKLRAKSTVLVIRIAPEDRALVEAVAAAHELETSTWARQTVVLAAKRWRAREASDAVSTDDSLAEPAGDSD